MFVEEEEKENNSSFVIELVKIDILEILYYLLLRHELL